MRLSTSSLLFFAGSSATPFFENRTTSTSRISTSSSSRYRDAINPSAINDTASNSPSHSNPNTASPITLFNNYTAAGNTSPYYNPAAFADPYYLILINTSGDLAISSLVSCGSIWTSSFEKWQKTAEVTTGPVIPASTRIEISFLWISTQPVTTETFEGTLTSWTTVKSSQSTILPQTITSISAGQGPLYYVQGQTGFNFTASEPCCWSCRIGGGKVQVFYWPTETQSPPVSTIINEAGFTFVSPSIYVGFESLSASNLCGNIGSEIAATTIGFAPGELSTSEAQFFSSSLHWLLVGSSITWTRATFGDHSDCWDMTRTFYNIGESQYTDSANALSAASSALKAFPMPDKQPWNLLTSHEFTYNPCLPTLSVPSQVLTINSLWSDCAAPITAFYDPPYALNSGNARATNAPLPSAVSPGLSARPAFTSSTAPFIPSYTSIFEVQPVRVLTMADSSTPSGLLGSVSSVDDSDPEQSLKITALPNDYPTSSLWKDPMTVSKGSNVDETILSFGHSIVTADGSSNFVIASRTLSPGNALTVSGTYVSLASNGAYAVLDKTSTQVLATATQAVSTSEVEYIISSHTLRQNDPAITIAGTVMSLLPGGSNILIGTSTMAMSSLLENVTMTSLGNMIFTIGGFVAESSTVANTSGSVAYNATISSGDGSKGDKIGCFLWLSVGFGLLSVFWL